MGCVAARLLTSVRLMTLYSMGGKANVVSKANFPLAHKQFKTKQFAQATQLEQPKPVTQFAQPTAKVASSGEPKEPRKGPMAGFL